MTNLFKCVTCGKTITGEEANTHKCEPPISRYKTIEAVSYFTVKNEKNEECVVIDALNGTGYTFEIKEPNLIPLTEGLPDLSTEGNTDSKPTRKQNLFFGSVKSASEFRSVKSRWLNKK